jgi:serine protease
MSTRRLYLLFALLALLVFATPAASSAAEDYVSGEVIVKYNDDTTEHAEAVVEQEAGTQTETLLPGGSEQLAIEDGETVAETVDELREDPNVAYAVPNLVARAARFIPNDPELGLQWNFFEDFGIGMPEAWPLAQAAGAPGGKGAVVAVLDSGVAYEDYGRFRRAPDLRRSSFVSGHDFIEGDNHPNDSFGHGTHVAGTIAQSTNNRQAVAGIAYNAKVMPLRVLDSEGLGDSVAIAQAIRYAARRGADVINLSVEFDDYVVASQIPDIIAAIRYAHRRGVVMVAAAGNNEFGGGPVAYPARAKEVIAVGATTEHGCLAWYSNRGPELDLAAPGGGTDADPKYPAEVPFCRPNESGHSIFQQTFTRRRPTRFRLVKRYDGTSMASPHVAGVAALVIASGKLGPHPSPAAVERHLEATARDLGAPGADSRYGFGLVDAARALGCPPATPC